MSDNYEIEPETEVEVDTEDVKHKWKRFQQNS